MKNFNFKDIETDINEMIREIEALSGFTKKYSAKVYKWGLEDAGIWAD